MIDKDQVPFLMAMIETTYRPVIKRAIANLILLDISQILSTLKLTYSDLKAIHDGSIKQRAILEILHSEKCKDALVGNLISIHRRQKIEIINEILKQYGLILLKDEQDFYHQHMGMVFEQEIALFREALEMYNYQLIYQISKEAYKQ